MEVLHFAPTASDFTPLSTHQSQTPTSFFSGPPVLYHHSASASLQIRKGDLDGAPALAGLFAGATASKADSSRANGTGTAEGINGDGVHAEEERDAMDEDEEADEELEVKGVDIWVTSEKFIIHSPILSTGISIPYPSISLHALQSSPPSLFLQLLTQASTFDDHDPDSTISLVIIPSAAHTSQPPTTSSAGDIPQPQDSPSSEETPTSALYAALSACANLHPDPASGSEADGEDQPGPQIAFEGDSNGIYPLSTNSDGTASGLPPPMPGSGGWITAENVSDFFDEQGNWKGGEEWSESEALGVPGGGLGEGAGSVRGRDAVDDGVDGGGGADGKGELGEEETKWRRTD